MAQPAVLVITRVIQIAGDAFGQLFDYFKRQFIAGLAIRRGGEVDWRQMSQACDGDIFVENLRDKQMNDCWRIEDTPAPVVAAASTDAVTEPLPAEAGRFGGIS